MCFDRAHSVGFRKENDMNDATTSRRRRPHPAHRSRIIAATSSVAGVVALTGWMAVQHASTAVTTNDIAAPATTATTAAATGATTQATTKSTTAVTTAVAAARAAQPSATAQSSSGGS